MGNNWKNIFRSGKDDVNPEKLMQYLNSELDSENAHNVETQSEDDPFLQDAMEGLESIEARNEIPHTVDQLNNNLRKQLRNSKSKRNKKTAAPEGWLYYAIVVILLLCIIAWVVIKKFIN